MTSWSKDEDKYRLPEGMVRIGYDADKQRYQFHDHTDGSLWEGPEGSHYGKLRRVSTSVPGGPDDKMFSNESTSKPSSPIITIPLKPVKGEAMDRRLSLTSTFSSATTATSPAPKDFDQILDNLGHERRPSEAGLRSRSGSTSGNAILDSAIKRSASVSKKMKDALDDATKR